MTGRGFGCRGVGSAIVAACLIAAPSAHAVERFATPGGTPGAACSEADPCDIQTGVEGARSGDVVNLAGDFSAGPDAAETVVIPGSVTVRGEPGKPVPRLTSAAPTAVFVGGFASVLRRIEIIHDSAPNEGGIGLAFAGGRAEQVTVRESTDGTPACGSKFVPGPYTIRDSFCLHSFGGNAFELVGANVESSAELINVTAKSRNRTDGTQPPREGSGIHVESNQGASATVTGINVIAQGNARAASSAISARETVDSEASVEMTSSNYADESQFTGTEITDPGTGSNQIVFPKFGDFAGNDFHQAHDSPTIDAGTKPEGMGVLDVDGELRSIKGTPDIGADEFVDGDGDRVPDRIDRCPATAAAQADGCPPVEPTPDAPPPPPAGEPAPQPPADPAPAPDAAPPADGDVPRDTAAPETRIDSGPKRVRRGRAAVFVLAADEPGAEFECRVDRAPFAACAERFVVRRPRPGKHAIEARAADGAGNVDPTPARATFKVLEARKRR